MKDALHIQRALLSVSDKSGIVELAQTLIDLKIEILSTGGTAQLLKQHNIDVTDISDYTGFPEMMDGRLKTLHPKIYGGILGRRDTDQEIMAQHQLPNIDLVVVNLYPFAQAIAQPDATLNKAIENIDIGGPTMIRAAAKNFAWCTTVTNPLDYPALIAELKQTGCISYHSRLECAKKAFTHTAQYDGLIANYFTSLNDDETTQPFSTTLNLQYELKEILRYGENPHQTAALYVDSKPSNGICQATQLQGKPLSYNNILDGQAALALVKRFDTPACVIVKHSNPCGVALGQTPLLAYKRAHQCDAQSAFGGIIAFNQLVDDAVITQIFENQFVEVILAPDFTPAAVEIAKMKPNCRLLCFNVNASATQPWEFKSVEGGLLIQSSLITPPLPFEVVTEHQPDQSTLENLAFAWEVCKSVKSNAIVIANDKQTLGIGAGQTSRIFSLEAACLRAEQSQLNLKGAVLASDAFFPFKDSIERASQAGISAIIQPGGSQRDAEVIAAANDLGISMVFTQMRYFLH